MTKTINTGHPAVDLLMRLRESIPLPKPNSRESDEHRGRAALLQAAGRIIERERLEAKRGPAGS